MPELPREMYHYVDAANWEFIQRDGLLSADMILRRGAFGPHVEAVVRAHRPRGVTLPNGTYIRDQSPMAPAALAPALDDGLTPRCWYDLANRHVFFWLDRERVTRHARALKGRAQVLLTIDVAALVAAHEGAIYVTPFNIGNARRKPARRGIRTLVSVESFQKDAWKSETAAGAKVRPRSHKPAELMVRDSVADIAHFITATRPIKP